MDDRSAIKPLTGELRDGISEAVLVSSHPRGRSDAIFGIVQEICETIAWLHGSAAVNDLELASLRRLLAEAQAHQQRMEACRLIEVVGHRCAPSEEAASSLPCSAVSWEATIRKLGSGLPRATSHPPACLYQGGTRPWC